jgi:hypothetical protein
LLARARVKWSQAGKDLIDGLAMVKPEQLGSDEVKAVIGALKMLAPVMPEVAEGLGHSEIQSMLAGAQGVKPGGPPPTMLGTPRPSPAMMQMRGAPAMMRR